LASKTLVKTPHKNKISEAIEQNVVDFCVLPGSRAAVSFVWYFQDDKSESAIQMFLLCAFYNKNEGRFCVTDIMFCFMSSVQYILFLLETCICAVYYGYCKV